MPEDLTPKEADNVIKIILPNMKKWIDPQQNIFERGFLRLSDIGRLIPIMKRAGETSDTYCKLANASLKYGVAIDLRKDTRDNMVLSFRLAKPKDIPPTTDVCLARWKIINNLPFDQIRSFNYEENIVDTLGQEDAVTILKEL